MDENDTMVNHSEAADTLSADGNVHALSTVVDSDGKLRIPDIDNDDARRALREYVSTYIDKRGKKTLLEYLENYQRTKGVLMRHREQIETSIRFINGYRSSGIAHAAPATLETTARAYFNKLVDDIGVAALRQQCALFNVDFDAYETIDEAVEALVEKQLTLAT
jgi:hypothetical protein